MVLAGIHGYIIIADRDQHGPLIALYLLEDCGHKEAHVDLEPANPFLNASHRKLQIVRLAIIICGGKVVRTERAQQQGQKQVKHLGNRPKVRFPQHVEKKGGFNTIREAGLKVQFITFSLFEMMFTEANLDTPGGLKARTLVSNNMNQ